MHVLVIGAGCTGLLLAQGLKKAGIQVSVFERSGHDRPFRDWTMLLHWGREYVKELLPEHIADRFYGEAETDPYLELTEEERHYHPVYNGKTGEVLVKLPWPSIKRYSRARAVKILSEGLDVQYSKKLVDIAVSNAGVKAIFQDSITTEGDILVGTDSANSFVRSWLFEHDEIAKASDLPIVAFNFHAKYPAELAVRIREHPHRLNRLVSHPEHNTWYMLAQLEVLDPQKPATWIFQHFMTHWTDEVPAETSEKRLKHFKELGATYAEPFRSAILKVDDRTHVPSDKLKYWAHPTKWDNRGGRVTLAGDAAHPFPPHRGQGLNNGFQDAANLVKAIAGANCQDTENAEGGSLQTCVEAYETELLVRGKTEIEASCKQAYISTHFEHFSNGSIVKTGLRAISNAK